MTNKIQKIREGIEKLKSNLIHGACSSQVAMETRCKEEAYNDVLAILDTMQEQHKETNFLDELKTKLDSMSKEEFEQVWEKYRVEEEPVSEQDFPVFKENVKNWKEPVSEELEEAIGQSFVYHEKHGDDFRSDKQIETAYRYGFETGANWQKQKDSIVSEALEDAASSFARKDSEGISNPANFYKRNRTMSKAEDYITQNTKTLEEYGKEYFKWLTPDQARKAVEIAREEVIEWIDNHWREYVNVDADGVVCFGHWKNDLRKAMEDE